MPIEKAFPTDSSQVASDFLSFFKTVEPLHVEAAGRIYESLAKTILDYNLSALSVECFPLASKCNSTACLALSKLAMDGIPAGCEGDTCSMIGMMLAKDLLGVVPWMANIVGIDGYRLTLAHCTAPADMLRSFTLDTHFETNVGVAIKGEIRAGEFTLFRVNNELTRMFLGVARAVPSKPVKNACHTQLVLEIDDATRNYFIETPLGNHHLVVPNNRLKELWMAAKALGLHVLP